MHSVRMARLQWPQRQRMITQREGTRRRLLGICRENNQTVLAAEVIRLKLHRESHAAIGLPFQWFYLQRLGLAVIRKMIDDDI